MFLKVCSNTQSTSVFVVCQLVWHIRSEHSSSGEVGASIADRVLHLHGAISEQNLAWPTYTKFAYRTTKTTLGPRWKQAFEVLRDHAAIKKLVFIGYSMPASDLEAKGLFNYTDWYQAGHVFQLIGITPNLVEQTQEDAGVGGSSNLLTMLDTALPRW
jgi:hypothetical protein